MTKRPPRLPLTHEYHDAQVLAIELGPRREVTITVQLDPVWNDGQARECRLHFSEIKTFEDVTRFFERGMSAVPAEAFVDEVVGIVRPSKGVIGIDLARRGFVELHGAKVREP